MNIIYTIPLKYYICAFIIIIAFLYIFFGRKKHYQVVGLQPLYDTLRLPTGEYIDFRIPSSDVLPQSSTSAFRAYKEQVSPIHREMEPAPPTSPYVEPIAAVARTGKRKSKGEIAACQALHDITGNTIQHNVRNLGVRNPETGRQLEIDCYDPVDQVAVEYNGRQHYEFCPRYHKTQSDFECQQRRDAYKAQQLDSMGIKLITVPYTVNMKASTDDEHYQMVYSHIKNELER